MVSSSILLATVNEAFSGSATGGGNCVLLAEKQGNSALLQEAVALALPSAPTSIAERE